MVDFEESTSGDWLVKIAQSIYGIARSFIKVNGTFSEDFLVHVALHQGSG